MEKIGVRMQRLWMLMWFMFLFVAGYYVGHDGNPNTGSYHDEYLTDGDFIVEYYMLNLDNYCFSFWAPHGGLWNEICYETADECAAQLSDAKGMHQRVNTDACYHPSIVPAWCVNGLRTGFFRQYDFSDDSYEVLARVCTTSYEQCAQFLQYQHPSHPGDCHGQMVMTRESEASYLTPASEITDLINANKQLSKDGNNARN